MGGWESKECRGLEKNVGDRCLEKREIERSPAPGGEQREGRVEGEKERNIGNETWAGVIPFLGLLAGQETPTLPGGGHGETSTLASSNGQPTRRGPLPTPE